VASDPDLSVIIVNWNSVAFLEQCLHSLFQTVTSIQLEVIVVDNGSKDGCDTMLERRFPLVRFIQSEENVGFPRANNLGFGYSKGRNLLFLNPDTEVLPSAIERMMRFLDNTPDAGLVGAQLLNTDGTIQTSCIQRLPTILNQAIDLEFLRARMPRLDLWGIRPLIEAPTSTASVEVISGACLMIRRSLFEALGMFETSYFMYAEDVDLCLRALRAGLKNYYVGHAVVVHHGGQSSATSSDSNFGAVMNRESLYRYFKVHRSLVYALGYRISTSLISFLRLSILGVLLLVAGGTLRRPAVRGALAKWVKILRWSIGLESWAKYAGLRAASPRTV
jgi:GT2 family glycosyltransferase